MGVNSPPILPPGPPFNVPIRWTRVYPTAFDHFLKYRGRQRHLIQHHCNGVVSKPALRSSALHWQRFLNRSQNLDPGGIVNLEPKEYQADTVTAEPRSLAFTPY